MVGAAFSSHLSSVYCREEECISGPVELPRPGPSHRVVPSSSGVGRDLRGLRLQSCRFVSYTTESSATYLCLSSFGSLGIEARCFLTSTG